MKYLKLSILSLILGLAAGVLIWLVLMAMVVGMKVVWEIVPDYFSWSDNLVYDLAVCVLGGRLLAWVHRVFGPGPEPMFAVFARVQREGGYPYHNLHWLALAFLLPIVFGGAVGPAAGITGFVAGLWTFVSACINEGRWPGAKVRASRLPKRQRVVFYSIGALAAVTSLAGLLVRVGGIHLPRFAREHAIGWSQWKWALALIALGVVLAILYTAVDASATKMAERLAAHTSLMCVVTGGIVGVVAHYLPAIPFAGDVQLRLLFSSWTSYTVGVLLLAALLKMLLTIWCLHFGWGGGNFFPVIFIGTAASYAFTMFVEQCGAAGTLDENFAAALVVSAMVGYLVRNPWASIAVLLCCFPLTYIIPLTVAVVVAGKVATGLTAYRRQSR